MNDSARGGKQPKRNVQNLEVEIELEYASRHKYFSYLSYEPNLVSLESRIYFPCYRKLCYYWVANHLRFIFLTILSLLIDVYLVRIKINQKMGFHHSGTTLMSSIFSITGKRLEYFFFDPPIILLFISSLRGLHLPNSSTHTVEYPILFLFRCTIIFRAKRRII